MPDAGTHNLTVTLRQRKDTKEFNLVRAHSSLAPEQSIFPPLPNEIDAFTSLTNIIPQASPNPRQPRTVYERTVKKHGNNTRFPKSTKLPKVEEGYALRFPATLILSIHSSIRTHCQREVHQALELFRAALSCQIRLKIWQQIIIFS